MGPPPFPYQVRPMLDGVEYCAVIEWLHDVITGFDPSVALDLGSALPALADEQ